MNRAIIVLSIVVLLMILGFTHYANYLENELTASYKQTKIEKSKSESYYDINFVGEKTLLLNELSEDEKKEVWNASTLKDEMVDFFPNFIKMSRFVNNRVIDNGLFKKKLLTKIKNTEEQFIVGAITGQSAKETLSTF